VSSGGLLIVLPIRSKNSIPHLFVLVTHPVSGDVVVGFVDPSDVGRFSISIRACAIEVAVKLSFGCSFFVEMAEVEVLGDGVGEFIEFFLINFTWVFGVDFASGFFDPLPFFLGDGVVLSLSEILNSNFDFIVGEGFVVVGVKRFEFIFGHLSGDAFWG